MLAVVQNPEEEAAILEASFSLQQAVTGGYDHRAPLCCPLLEQSRNSGLTQVRILEALQPKSFLQVF